MCLSVSLSTSGASFLYIWLVVRPSSLSNMNTYIFLTLTAYISTYTHVADLMWTNKTDFCSPWYSCYLCLCSSTCFFPTLNWSLCSCQSKASLQRTSLDWRSRTDIWVQAKRREGKVCTRGGMGDRKSQEIQMVYFDFSECSYQHTQHSTQK